MAKVSMYVQAVGLALAKATPICQQLGYSPAVTASQVPPAFTAKVGHYTVTVTPAYTGVTYAQPAQFTAVWHTKQYPNYTKPVYATSLGLMVAYCLYRTLAFGQVPPKLRPFCTPVKLQA
jgi:hypothetical protein